jgi:predicted metal-dependent enzyme (double-stranded beta helix superfamily)
LARQHAAMPMLRLQTLVDRLSSLPPAQIELARVAAMLADGELDAAELRRYVGALPHKYARRPVHRSRHFDVMVLSWAPGQFTPVHNHAGNCGWVRLVRGQIQEERFALAPSSCPADVAIAATAPAAAGSVSLVPTGSAVIAAVGAVATVDRQRAIHRLGNPAGPGGDLAVTLHVYSLPHDRCVAFDPVQQRCTTREMEFDALAE